MWFTFFFIGKRLGELSPKDLSGLEQVLTLKKILIEKYL